ncbi:hypothetical protein, partial [Anaerococcus porci]|uniref:hypothetical protein n=1 Tax=Anaerococcus porci TaxID=2652269 RepID=UPI002A75FB39
LMDEECLEGTENKGIAIGKPLEFSREDFFEKLDNIINQDNIDDINIFETINTLISTFIGKKI